MTAAPPETSALITINNQLSAIEEQRSAAYQVLLNTARAQAEAAVKLAIEQKYVVVTFADGKYIPLRAADIPENSSGIFYGIASPEAHDILTNLLISAWLSSGSAGGPSLPGGLRKG